VCSMLSLRRPWLLATTSGRIDVGRGEDSTWLSRFCAVYCDRFSRHQPPVVSMALKPLLSCKSISSLMLNGMTRGTPGGSQNNISGDTNHI
jgi:hypothetical protein